MYECHPLGGNRKIYNQNLVMNDRLLVHLLFQPTLHGSLDKVRGEYRMFLKDNTFISLIYFKLSKCNRKGFQCNAYKLICHRNAAIGIVSGLCFKCNLCEHKGYFLNP